MLVLSRKENQSIVIGDDIEITVCSVGPTRVRLAIQAPREVKVIRTELLRRVSDGKAQEADKQKRPG